MKRIFVVLISVALLAPSVSATAAPKVQNNWSITQKIVYVGLTPMDQPDFWTAGDRETTTALTEGAMLSYAKSTVTNAIRYWKQASRDKMKFGSSKFFLGKPGTAVKHCNPRADIKTAMKIAGLKSIPTGTHLVAVNIYDSCGYAGLGTQGGGEINLRSFETATLVHELGHNFGFSHSATIFCKNSDYTKFNATNCSLEEYGDFRDVMGSDDWCPNTTLSATQRATVFSIPKVKDLIIGVDTTVDESRLTTDRIVYQFTYKGTSYFFEYYIPGEERCIAFRSFLNKPHIQVRMVGPAWTKAKGNIVGPILIERSGKDLPAGEPELDSDGDPILPEFYGTTLTGFQAGEKFQLPGAPYVLTVKSTGATSAVFTITKS